MKRDLTYYRKRKEQTSFGTAYIPYAYDGPLTYTVAKEAINNLTGMAYKLWHSKQIKAPRTLIQAHQEAIRQTRSALANLYGWDVSDRLYDAAIRQLKERNHA